MVSLQLELTNIFPIGKIVSGASAAVVEFARELRKSGSDLLVEEELADIFSRGRINTELEDDFKKAVLSKGDVVGIRQNDGSAKTGIMLDSRPGPSLQRAIDDPTKQYLSTLIQLSLLNWMHGRASLASAICECMNARFQAGAPGSTPNSGVEAVQSMLDACSSQTGSFNWNGYVQAIETKIAKTYTDFQHLSAFMALSPKLLLACMDYL